jgi:hypothetical protein
VALGEVSSGDVAMGEVSDGDVRIDVLLIEDDDFDIGMEV